MLDKNNILKEKEYIDIFNSLNKKNLSVIYLTISGSHAYGTNNEDSDIDIRGIFLNPIESRIGIRSPIEDYHRYRKAPAFRHGDVRHVHRICISS